MKTFPNHLFGRHREHPVRRSTVAGVRCLRKTTALPTLSVLIACAAILFAVLVDRAAAGNGGPSTFTGLYAGEVSAFVTLDISSDGKVSGTWTRLFWGGTVSGRVTDSGDMNLGFHSTTGGGRKGRKGVTHATAMVSLDEDGDLVGLWLWDSSDEPWPFEFIRISGD